MSKVKLHDYIIHTNNPGVFKVVEIISTTGSYYFKLKQTHGEKNVHIIDTFNSSDEYVKKIITLEENPEYFL